MPGPIELSGEPTTGAPSPLASFVNANEAEILGAWVRAVSERPAGRDLPRSMLAARAYPLLAALARAPADRSTLESMGRELARTRFAEGLDLAELVAQYTILRDILITRWSATAAPADSWPGVGAINRAIDAAVNAALAASAELRAGALRTIQSLSMAVLENVTLDELLHRLLTAFQEIAPAVQAAAFYLTDDDRLRLHASFGISDEDTRGATVKVGQGFPGRIAAEKRALLLRVPSAEPVTPAPWKKMRVVQGRPLIVRGHLVGVAVMGSYNAWDFAKADQVAFEVVAKQAMGNIHDWKVRESIEDQKARLDAVLAQMPAGVILAETPAGRMTLHNAQVEAIWRRPFIACGSVEEYHAWPAYRSDGRRLESEEFPLARALAGKVVVNQEVEVLRGDGSRGTIMSNAAPIRARDGRIVGGVTTFVDITEKRTTERQLREMAAQAQSAEAVQAIVAEASIQLAESFQEGTTVHSIVRLAVPRIADGCALFLTSDGQRPQLHEIAHVDARKAGLMRTLLGNPAPEKKFGELVDRICRTQKPEIVPIVTEEILRNISANEDDRTMLRELGLASVMMFPLVARGRALGVIAFAATSLRKDFSRQDVALAQELTRRSACAIDNQRLYQEAQHAVHLRDEVLEIVSHDLRGPLSSVHLSADMLAQAEGAEESVRKRAERILSATLRMERLIRSLVDFAAIRSGRLSIERAPADVARVVLEVCRGLEDQSGRAGVVLEQTVEPGLPLVNIDRARIHQGLENLICNALKVVGAGKAVTVAAFRQDREIHFTVADNGPGIPAEDLPRLFERYFRGGDARGSGLGLGLAITRAIVEGHGGRVWVESALGQGSTFSFSIPLGA